MHTNNEKYSRKKKILKLIKRILIILVLIGIAISTIPSIELDTAYQEYKSALPSIKENETKIEYVKRLYEQAIKSNNKLTETEKSKLIDTFTTLVLNNIGIYFTEESLIQMMAVAKTQSIKELTSLEKRFSWYTGFYNKYLNQLVLDDSIDNVEDTLLAHEQLHAILRNSFYTKSYALNEAMTKNSVKGDESYIYLDLLHDVLTFVIGKEKLYDFFLRGDLEGLKEEMSKYISKEDANRLIVSYDDVVFSHFYTSFLSRIDLEPGFKTLKDQENSEMISRSILEKLFEKRFNCKIQDSSLSKVIFGYYTPHIAGLTYIKDKVGYYEPLCHVNYLNSEEVEIIIEFMTSNIDTKTGDFYHIRESYIIDIEELGSTDMESLIEDARKKHNKDLIDKPFMLS